MRCWCSESYSPLSRGCCWHSESYGWRISRAEESVSWPGRPGPHSGPGPPGPGQPGWPASLARLQPSRLEWPAPQPGRTAWPAQTGRGWVGISHIERSHHTVITQSSHSHHTVITQSSRPRMLLFPQYPTRATEAFNNFYYKIILICLRKRTIYCEFFRIRWP